MRLFMAEALIRADSLLTETEASAAQESRRRGDVAQRFASFRATQFSSQTLTLKVAVRRRTRRLEDFPKVVRQRWPVLYVQTAAAPPAANGKEGEKKIGKQLKG
ncbi:hypothetical protein SKAU_G00314040 [Synaphobranchus kaupii]|uniref:Uncharacterized protein n=1 Tax=Synaphobranchus kaupii TaxID=118154 RepID=A0A9Q1ES86_SYNKA|nr:hypothetical protein SKAU_G00314040 [Synaphobranchus kaupii]